MAKYFKEVDANGDPVLRLDDGDGNPNNDTFVLPDGGFLGALPTATARVRGPLSVASGSVPLAFIRTSNNYYADMCCMATGVAQVSSLEQSASVALQMEGKLPVLPADFIASMGALSDQWSYYGAVDVIRMSNQARVTIPFNTAGAPTLPSDNVGDLTYLQFDTAMHSAVGDHGVTLGVGRYQLVFQQGLYYIQTRVHFDLKWDALPA